MTADILRLVAVILLCISVPWFALRWSQLRAWLAYELEMRRVRREIKRTGVRYPVPRATVKWRRK